MRPHTQPLVFAAPFGLRQVATAAALAAAFLAGGAHALTLGRLTVLSKLGEPLLAEIDVPQLTEAEAASLRVSTGSPDTYRAAGAEFSAALAGADIQLVRRPDGRPVLRVRGNRSVNEPYIDLILEANWSAGRIVRDYTMLFDPPDVRTNTSAPPPAPLILPPLSASPSPAPATVPATPVPATVQPAEAQRPPAATPPTATARPATAAPAEPKVPAARATEVKPSKAQPSTKEGNDRPSQVTVKAGETAGRIAAQYKPATVTLDQMLVAMMRDNPDAFIGGNVNRIKAGAVVQLADASSAAAVPADEARRTIQAQIQDFGAYRKRLATAVADAPAQASGSQRKASGKIQTEVSESQPSAQQADKLKLSKGMVASKDQAAKEDAVIQARKAQEQSAREAELTKNLADLNKLAAPAPAAAEPPAPASPAPAPAEPPPPASPAPVAEPPPPAPAPVEKPADKPTEPVQAPTSAAPPPQPPSEAEGGEVSLIDSLADNPLTLPAAGLLVAGLIGLAGYRWRQRRKGTPVDSSFLESKIQPDSFFGSSGGQSIDTSEAVATGSSMMYSPSQLDAGGDVDPVAEADVYLAYGRDLQAEEILKEALRINPKRVAIHAKLLEIYAKRRDAKAYEVLACEVYALTGGQGPEWDAVCLQGQELDPANPLYQPGGKPAALADAPTGFQPSMMPPGMANTQPFMPLEEDPRPEATAPASVDLDLDFSIDDSPAPAQTAFNQNPPDLNEALGNEPLAFTMPEEGSASVPSAKPLPDSAFELQASDLEFSIPDEAPVSTLADPSPEAASPNEMALDFDFPNATDPMAGSPMDQTVRLEPTEPPAQLDDDHLMAFNTGEMPLDSGNGDSISPLDDIPEGDPLETKLSLAAEFMAIGDMEGARSLAEEVEEQATGRLKEKAKAFLADLG